MFLSEKTKKFLSLLLRVGLSFALLVYLFSKTDTHSILTLLKTVDFESLYWAGGIFIVLNLILLYRWIILIRALRLELPMHAIWTNYFIGLFFNLFLPSSTGGDVVKIIGLCKFTPYKAKVVASVVLDRLVGFVAIVMMEFISFFIGRNLLNDTKFFLASFLFALMAGGLCLILFNEKIFSFGCRLFNRFPKIKTALMNLHYDVVLLKDRKRKVALALAWSCFSQVILSWTFYLVAKAIHQDINFIYFLIFVPIICVVSSLPSIGGLGVRDYGAAHLFAKIGVSAGIAVSITLINFFFMVLIGLVGGIIYVSQISSRRLQHHAPSAGFSSKGV